MTSYVNAGDIAPLLFARMVRRTWLAQLTREELCERFGFNAGEWARDSIIDYLVAETRVSRRKIGKVPF
jgi:hypothetical protein